MPHAYARGQGITTNPGQKITHPATTQPSLGQHDGHSGSRPYAHIGPIDTSNTEILVVAVHDTMSSTNSTAYGVMTTPPFDPSARLSPPHAEQQERNPKLGVDNVDLYSISSVSHLFSHNITGLVTPKAWNTAFVGADHTRTDIIAYTHLSFSSARVIPVNPDAATSLPPTATLRSH